MKNQCLRCGHSWESEAPIPNACAKCKSKYWARPRARAHLLIVINALAEIGETIYTEPLKAWRGDGPPDGPNDVDWQYMKQRRDAVLRKCKRLGIRADYQVTYTHLRVYRTR